MPPLPEEDFNPAFGSPLVLRPEGLENDLRAFFIGMEPAKYVICSPGNALADRQVLAALRDKKRRVRLFYLRQGVMRGFTVRVLGFKTSPFRHLFLSFPEISQTFNLRLHDRVECHLPARIADLAGAARGMVSNISLGGCRLSLLCEGRDHAWLREGECYELSLQLPTLDTPLRCHCRLAQRPAASDEHGLLHLGLGFLSFDPQHRDQIDEFIRRVSEYRI